MVLAAAAASRARARTVPAPGVRPHPPAGIIRGHVVYSGPRPCSSSGHVIGSGLVLVFDRRNPPPPNGLASTALNFVAVEGDVLFANEPRYAGTERLLPSRPRLHRDRHGVGAVRHLAGRRAASYVLESFYDTPGDFFPTFKFRELPERGDVGGGAIDTADALKSVNAGNLNYQPHFLPVDVGIPVPATSRLQRRRGGRPSAGSPPPSRTSRCRRTASWPTTSRSRWASLSR